MASLPLPRNAKAILAAREQHKRPELPVIVSYVGDLNTPCPVVYADSGKRYDWDFLTGLSTAIAVRDGIDATDAIRGLFERMSMAYPVLFDAERKQCASVVRVRPKVLLQGYGWQSSFGPPATLMLRA